MQKNFDYFCNYLLELKRSPDVIAVTETKLYDNAIHANIDIMGYSFIHCDRVTRAGGVVLYIKHNTNFDINSSLSCALAFVEDLWINILTKSGTLAVGVVYRVGSIHFFFLILKFKFIDFEKTKFKFKFIDFEKMKFKFKFIDFEKTKFKFKFIDFEKMKFKFKFIDFETTKFKFKFMKNL